jgi:5-methylcytosine-specific restriction endonuclease McrA
MSSKHNIDLTGRKFGSLIAITKAPINGINKYNSYDRWECLCSCGNKIVSLSYNLLKGLSTTCGPNHAYLVGKKFGKLTVIKRLNNSLNNQNRFWLCLCECGTKKAVTTHCLTSGKISDCGCVPQNRYHDRSIPAKNSLLYDYRRNAKIRGIAFSLTPEEFFSMTELPCFYCGSLPSNLNKIAYKNPSAYTYSGIDRKNNFLGYTLENCVPCCFSCNRAKNNHTYEEFKSWAVRLEKNIEKLIKNKALKILSTTSE